MNGEAVGWRGDAPGPPPEGERGVNETNDIDVLHEIGSRFAAADSFHAVLSRIAEFASSVVQCDS